MRYRMEIVDDERVIKKVETDVALGTTTLIYGYDRTKPIGCNVYNKNGTNIAVIPTATVPNPMQEAPFVIAEHEKAHGYPGLKAAVKGADPQRMEWLLGATLADAVCTLARAAIEWNSGGLQVQTKEKCCDLLGQLYHIWYASRFGSFDGERMIFEPNFFNGRGGPRMGFAEAARYYGLAELSFQFPDESESVLKELLKMPLLELEGLLNRLLPSETRIVQLVAARAQTVGA